MNRKASVLHAAFPPDRRVLAVSDIHGNLPFLEGLLKAARYTPQDILVFVGDLVEKGPDSLAVLRFVMELSQTNTVYALRGHAVFWISPPYFINSQTRSVYPAGSSRGSPAMSRAWL